MIRWISQHGIETLIALLLAIIAWLLKRFIATVDSHTARLTALEADRVNRADLDELRSSLMATITQNHDRIESRLDKIWQHLSGSWGNQR